MVRRVIAAAGATVGLVALAPPAGATDYTGQLVLLQQGTVKCLVSANDGTFGGGPMTVCALSNGEPWGKAPFEESKWNQRLNLVVVRGTGEFYRDRGLLPDPAQLPAAPVSVDSGTYQVNGWTIQPQGLRTQISYDATGHGMFINQYDTRGF